MKRTNFYPQGQRRMARILLTIWLLISYSPNIAFAVPEAKAAGVPASSTSPCHLALASAPHTAAWGHLAVAPRLPLLTLG